MIVMPVYVALVSARRQMIGRVAIITTDAIQLVGQLPKIGRR
jgi:hypothetical protein